MCWLERSSPPLRPEAGAAEISGLVTFVEVRSSQQSPPSMFEQSAMPHVDQGLDGLEL